MSTSNYVPLSYFLHNSIDIEIMGRVARLELPASTKVNKSNGRNTSGDKGVADDLDPSRGASELAAQDEVTITVQIYSMGEPLHAVPMSSHTPTRYDAESNCIVCDDVLIFPVKYRDLSRDACMVIVVWTVSGWPAGGASLPLFDSGGALRQGLQKVVFTWTEIEKSVGVGALRPDPNAHLEVSWWQQHLAALRDGTEDEYRQLYEAEDHAFRTEKVLEGLSLGDVPRVEWLDAISLERAEKMILARVSDDGVRNVPPPYLTQAAKDMRKQTFAVIELPSFAYTVIFEDKSYLGVGPLDVSLGALPDTAANAELDEASFNALGAWAYFLVADFETEEKNPVEDKYRKIAHDLLRGLVDPELKPNKDERERLDIVVNSHSVGDHLKMEEKDLLWKFRHCLTDNKKALTKFLLSVDWSVEQEVAQIDGLLAQWHQRAPIDVSDALKLLGREKAFQAQVVRRFAVEALSSASDAELLAYMLQLVQALRYEPDSISTTTSTTASPTQPERATNDDVTGTPPLKTSISTVSAVTSTPGRALTPLAAFLVERACRSLQLASYLYWYLKVELEDASHGATFREVFNGFQNAMMTGGSESKHIIEMLQEQERYIMGIADAHRIARDEKGRKAAKEDKLRVLLKEPAVCKPCKKGTVGTEITVPLPLDPSMKVTGLRPATAFMFRSALYPCVVEFTIAQDASMHTPFIVPIPSPSTATTVVDETSKPGKIEDLQKSYKVIFKSGDDLRQDQLVIQMISLMDGLLKRVNLDLKLIPYKILATGPKDGLVEFVESSSPVSAVLSNYSNSITEYLRHFNPDPQGPMGVKREAMSTFVKSTAGYCVITYILGIGDRHLDNLMLLPAGNLFHIDFGYIFGRDPKPMAPPFRFTREMADAMGGLDSEYYRRFKTHCCQAYTWLRKSANLILNLLNLMVDAGIEALSSDPVAVLGRVEDRFRLDLTDEQAEEFFVSLIDESLRAFAPRVMEVMHQLAVARR